MSIRERRWKTSKGEARRAWILDYFDRDGVRRQETFERSGDAKAREAEITVDLRKGVHTPRSVSPTVAKVGAPWFEYVTLKGLEKTTLSAYRLHVDRHINPLTVDDGRGPVKLGDMKVVDLTAPFVEAVRVALLCKLSRPMAKKVFITFRAVVSYAQRKGHVAQNVAASAESIEISSRDKHKLEVGVDIPSREEVSAMIAHAGALRPMLTVSAFSGLRVSELRGLRWSDVDFKANTISVRQRMDRFNEIGRPKTKSSARTLPVGPAVIKMLKEWRLACPNGETNLVFPGEDGDRYPYSTSRDHLRSVQVAADVVSSAKRPKYAWHAFRHFYASWLINRRVDGGLELPLKLVSERLGHSSITETANTYGHLFPSKDDGSELAAAKQAVLSLHAVGDRSSPAEWRCPFRESIP
jgi:integrase